MVHECGQGIGQLIMQCSAPCVSRCPCTLPSMQATFVTPRVERLTAAIGEFEFAHGERMDLFAPLRYPPSPNSATCSSATALGRREIGAAG